MRYGVIVALLAVAAAHPLAQSAGVPETPLRFEAASVKLNTSATSAGSAAGLAGAGAGPGGGSIARRGQRFVVTNTPLGEIVRYAFDLEPYHAIDNGPRWLDDRYDITGLIPDGVTSPDAPRAMLRTLLAERFKLAVRRSKKELPVRTLVLAREDRRLGPRLSRSTADCGADGAAQRPAARAGDPPISAEDFERSMRPACDIVIHPFRARIYGGSRTMADLARVLSRVPIIAAPVVDRTGLSGSYDFELTFVPPTRAPAAGAADEPSPDPSIFIALQEQLGLKLEDGRAPVDVLVIERIEKPTEN